MAYYLKKPILALMHFNLKSKQDFVSQIISCKEWFPPDNYDFIVLKKDLDKSLKFLEKEFNDKNKTKIYFLENSFDYNGSNLNSAFIAGSEKTLINITNELAKDKNLIIKVFNNTKSSKINDVYME